MPSFAPCKEKMREVNYYFVQGNKENSFSQIYLAHANRIVSGFVARGKPEKISRARIEMDILGGFEKGDFPTAFLLACFSMVAHTDMFDVYWLSKRDEYGLSKAAITRIRPNYDLIFDVPLLSQPGSPTESIASFGSGSIGLSNASGSDSEESQLAEYETNGLETVASDEGVTSSAQAIPVIDEFTPAPTPAPDFEQALNAATGRQKRPASKKPLKPKPRAALKKKGTVAKKSPRAPTATNGDPGPYDPSAMDEDDDEDHLVLKTGQTGGKTVPPPKTGTKRPKAATAGKGKGGGKKAVRFDLPEN